MDSYTWVGNYCACKERASEGYVYPDMSIYKRTDGIKEPSLVIRIVKNKKNNKNKCQ